MGRAWEALTRAGAGLRERWWTDPILGLCFAWLCGVPLAAALLASHEPRPAADAIVVSAPAMSAAHVHVRALPLLAGAEGPLDDATLRSPSRMREALRTAAMPVVGRAAAARLVRFAERDTSFLARDGRYAPDLPYPFRYRGLERLLDQHLPSPLDAVAVAGANDLAVRMVHAAAMDVVDGTTSRPFGQGAAVAFALLQRARAGDACIPQLNLAFLLAADIDANREHVEAELQRAEADCPDDPTPLWLLGEYQSQRISLYREDGDPPRRVRWREPLRTFAALRGRFPGSAAGWAGAGDAELRIAYRLDPGMPFSARLHYRRALADFQAAQRVDRDSGLASGQARAWAGLGRFDRAALVQRHALAGRDEVAPLQEWLVEYLERAGRFAAAADVAARLASDPVFPLGEGYYMRPPSEPGVLADRGGQGPLSLGADHLTPASFDLGDGGGAGGASGEDISFIPVYHEVYDVTEYDRSCPAWSARRDLILAGRPREALARMPTSFRSIEPGQNYECAYKKDLLVGIAAREAGDRERAIVSARADAEPDDNDAESDEELLGTVDDARQNLWRFAGDLPRARVAARAWRTDEPEEPLAFDRSGEIEFLAGRFAAAEPLFARAATLARSTNGLASVTEAEALLKQGTTLIRLGRYDAAVRVLEDADATGSRAEGLSDQLDVYELVGSSNAAAFASYNALAQMGAAELRAHRFAQAAEHYEAARERLHGVYGEVDAGETISSHVVTFNNLSLAQAQSGHLRAAEHSAQRALDHDPLNPLALETHGYALARLGRDATAARAFEAAVRHSPSQFTAWCNLGVVEARRGHPQAALDALRHAVAAEPGYALGWFDLGALLEQRGLTHALAAQGAFGRAIKADPALRERTHRLLLDDDVYVTNLDLSKPLPAAWSFADGQRRTPAKTIGVVVLLIVALRLGRGLAGQSFSGSASYLDAVRGLLERLRGESAFAGAALALLATAGVFLVPLVRAGNANRVEVVLLLAGVGALLLAVHRARVLVARRDRVALEQLSWRPAVVVGLGAALLGASWAPLPIARTDRPAPAVHWVGACVTGVAAAVLLPMSVWLEVPFARTLAGAALVMTASMLVPVEPLDGGSAAKGKAGTAAGLALLGGGLLLLFGLS